MALPSSAADLTTAHLREEVPALASVAEDVLSRALIVALEIHTLSPLATVYCAAHLVSLWADEDASTNPAGVDDRGGVVIAETAGPIEAEYMPQAEGGHEVFFARTPYGRMFLMLERRATAFTPRVWG